MVMEGPLVNGGDLKNFNFGLASMQISTLGLNFSQFDFVDFR